MANATPVSPKDQFSGRTNMGLGVAHRGGPGNGGNVALFGNTPVDVLGVRNFVPHLLDFFVEDEVDTTNRWTLTNITGVAGAFGLIGADNPIGIAILDVGGTTDNHGVQVQHDVTTRESQLYWPHEGYSHVVGWEARGLVDYCLSSDWFVGLSETEAPFMDADGVPNGDNYMGFLHVEDETTVKLVQCGTANANAVEVTPIRSLWTPEDGMTTKRRIGLRVENHGQLGWYLDGVLVGKAMIGQTIGGVDVTAFDGPMCHTVCLVNGATVQTTASIDYFLSNHTRV